MSAYPSTCPRLPPWQRINFFPPASFTGMDLCSHMGPHAWGLALSLTLCFYHLEIASNFVFELAFCKWSLEQRKSTQYTCPLCSSLLDSHLACLMPLEHRVLMTPWCLGGEQNSNQVQGKHVTSTTKWDNPKRPCFPFQPERALNAKERQQPRTPNMSFLTCFPSLY